MSLFPRSFISSDPTTSFTPLFRLLDDFDQYSRANPNASSSSHGGAAHPSTRVLRTFSPKFDVQELPDAYELHGELPGIEQKDVEIEFTDDQTLTIKGHTERSYTQGTPSAGFIEGESSSTSGAGAIENGSTSQGKDKSLQPRVEDEDSTTADGMSKKESQVATTRNQQQQPQQQQSRFWVSERSVGEFSRSFSFPVRVDQDGVKASMRNGVLKIVVPKGRKVEGRKIEIS